MKRSLLLCIGIWMGMTGCGSGPAAPAVTDDTGTQAAERPTFDTGELPRLSTAERHTLDSLYRSLPEESLPVSFTDDSPSQGMEPLPAALRGYFFNAAWLDDDARAMRLPQSGDFRLLALRYRDNLDNPVTDLYAFTPQSAFTDRIRLNAREPLTFVDGTLIREAEMEPDGRLRIRKLRNDMLIEALYYAVDSAGNFAEVRDGRTPAIAFESPDDMSYTVELFTWDRNAAGGLYKKGLQIRNFTVDGTESGILADPFEVTDPER